MSDLHASLVPAAVALALLSGLSGAAAAGTGHWAPSKPSGCQMWSTYPQDSEEISWNGGCRDGKAEGKGELVLTLSGEESLRYSGEVQGGKYHGKGVERHADGQVYDGEWREDAFTGEGVYRDGQCEISGHFVNAAPMGKTLQVCGNGLRYEGGVHANRMEGFGSLTLSRDGQRDTIAFYRKARQGRWQGGVYRVTGWWEYGTLRVACADEAQCQSALEKLDAKQAKQAARERKAGINPFLLIHEEDAVTARKTPYAWLDSAGEELRAGKTDSKGRAFVVEKPGETQYRLRSVFDTWLFEVPASCWQRPAQAFRDCARMVKGPEQVAEDERSELDEKRARFKSERGAWAVAGSDAASRMIDLDQRLQEQGKWMQQPQAAFEAEQFSCQPFRPKQAPEALRAFDEAAAMERGEAQQLAYAKAAGLGSWRAAARLSTIAFEEEDWESAAPMIGWLFQRQAPAAYNKLADLLRAQGNYDGESLDAGQQSLEMSLRWRAAQLGDPLAQISMARAARQQGKASLANQLRDCAQSQNPSLSEQ